MNNLRGIPKHKGYPLKFFRPKNILLLQRKENFYCAIVYGY